MNVTRRKFKVEVPSMAMGDIAFNLLIFFVILAKAQDDSHIKWDPAATPKVEAINQVKARIAVDTNQKLYFNGVEISISQLSGAVKGASGNAPAGMRTVVLKIDKDAPAQRFEPIIEAVSEAGGELVHVLEEQKLK